MQWNQEGQRIIFGEVSEVWRFRPGADTDGGRVKLNLGCSDRKIKGYIGVDIAPPADQIVDLAGPWPWPDSSVDHVLAYDVCEHIGDLSVFQANFEFGYLRPDEPESVIIPTGRIWFMNELHRVLKPGARAIIETPNAARGVGYFQDPTHVSPWCMSTFRYFERDSFAHARLSKSYGITAAFRIVKIREEESPAEGFGERVWKIHAELEAVK